MTGLPDHAAIDWPERPDTSALDAEWVAVIERMRDEEAEALCTACAAVRSASHRRCSRCHREQPLASFPRCKSRPLGYGYLCLTCKRAENAQTNAERKRRQFRAILGRAS